MTSTIDPELLLRHSGWMRALAFELLGDFQQAEDLVQDAWVETLRGPAVELRHPRAWLARLVRFRASKHRRADSRRRLREQLAAREEALPSTQESLEQFALQREVVEAVLRLEVGARELVVLRYYEGLPPRVIARRLGLSGAAVRSRLSRALASLRQELDASQRGDRGRWVRALSAFAARPELLVGVAHSKAWLSIPLAVGLGLMGWLAAGQLRPEARPEVDAVLRTELEPDALPRELANEESPALAAPHEPSEPRERESAAAAAPTTAPTATRVAIHLRLVDPLGVPVGGVRGQLRGLEEPPVSSAADGRARFPLAWPSRADAPHDGSLTIDLDGPGIASRSVSVQVPRAQDVYLGDVVVEPGGIIEGQVVDSAGNAVIGAQVHAGELLGALPWGERQARVQGSITLGGKGAVTDEEGRYELKGVPARVLCVFGRCERGLYAFGEAFAVRAAERVRAPQLVLDPASLQETLFGQVLDPTGQPLAGARLSLAAHDSLRLGGASFSDSQGRFECFVPAARDHRLSISHPMFGESVVDPAPTGERLLVQLRAQRWITVSALDPTGRPIDSELSLRSSSRDDFGQPELGRPLSPGVARLRAPGQRFEIQVDALGWKAASLGPFEAEDAPEELEAVLQPAPGIHVRLVDEQGADLGGSLHLHALEPHEESEGWSCRVGRRLWVQSGGEARGGLLLETDFAPSLFESEFELHAELPGRARVTWSGLRLQPGARLELGELRWPPGGEIRGALAPEAEPAGRIVLASCGDSHIEFAQLGPDGALHLERLCAGSWRVGLLSSTPGISLAGLRQRPERGLAALLAGSTREVVVRDGESSWVELDAAAPESRCRLSGEVRLRAGSAGLQSGVVANDWGLVAVSLDAQGRFSASLDGVGRASIRLSGSCGAGVQLQLSAVVELGSVPTSWSYLPATGTLELVGLDSARGAREADSARPWLRLVRTPDEREPELRFEVTLGAVPGDVLRLDDLPVGEYVLESSSASTRVSPNRGTPELRLEVRAGALATHDLGS